MHRTRAASRFSLHADSANASVSVIAPALLVIDIIRAFTDPESPLGSDLDAETGAIRRVAAAASKNGAPIIYSTIAYRDPDAGRRNNDSKEQGSGDIKGGHVLRSRRRPHRRGACEQLASEIRVSIRAFYQLAALR